MNKNTQEEKETVTLPSWLIMSMMCIFLAIIIVVLYLQFIRYALVARAIDKGDNTSTALLLTPEISMGIARLF